MISCIIIINAFNILYIKDGYSIPICFLVENEFQVSESCRLNLLVYIPVIYITGSVDAKFQLQSAQRINS